MAPAVLDELKRIIEDSEVGIQMSITLPSSAVGGEPKAQLILDLRSWLKQVCYKCCPASQ